MFPIRTRLHYSTEAEMYKDGTGRISYPSTRRRHEVAYFCWRWHTEWQRVLITCKQELPVLRVVAEEMLTCAYTEALSINVANILEK